MSVNDSKSVVYYNIFSLPVNRPCNYSLIGLILLLLLLLIIIIIIIIIISVFIIRYINRRCSALEVTPFSRASASSY